MLGDSESSEELNLFFLCEYIAKRTIEIEPVCHNPPPPGKKILTFYMTLYIMVTLQSLNIGWQA